MQLILLFDLIYSIVPCCKFVLWFNAPRSSHVRRLMARIVTLWLSLSQGPVNSTSSASSACESTPRSLYFCFYFCISFGQDYLSILPGWRPLGLLFPIFNHQGIFNVRNVHTGPTSLSSVSDRTRYRPCLPARYLRESHMRSCAHYLDLSHTIKISHDRCVPTPMLPR